MTRKFEDTEAKRGSVPVLVALMGPSGGGKTYSALRLATGIQRVSGGEIFLVDTEARRALHYADKFKFRHVNFGAPFGPLDYLDVLNYCVERGAKTIIIDSMSHEHEGPGGVLEMHDAEALRMAKGDTGRVEKFNMLAWGKPKGDRRRLINSILQMGVNLILNFRAKEKLRIVPGSSPKPLGWQPIGGDEFVYEMTASCLLRPNAGGVPCWNPELESERMMVKLPEQYRDTFLRRHLSKPLSEETGEEMARWAAGGEIDIFRFPGGECKGKTIPEAPDAYLTGLLAGSKISQRARGLIEAEMGKRMEGQDPGGRDTDVDELKDGTA